jgi:hypothetical protein
MPEKKLWHIIIDDTVKEQYPSLQAQFTGSSDDFVFGQARSEVQLGDRQKGEKNMCQGCLKC